MDKIIFSTAEFGEFVGIAPRTVNRLTNSKILIKHKNQYGKYDLKENVNRYYKYRLYVEKKKYDNSSKEMKQLRFRKEAAETELKEMELDEKRGELINRKSYDQAFFKLVRSARDAILKIPYRIGDIIAAETDSKICKKILREELKQTLNEFGENL